MRRGFSLVDVVVALTLVLVVGTIGVAGVAAATRALTRAELGEGAAMLAEQLADSLLQSAMAVPPGHGPGLSDGAAEDGPYKLRWTSDGADSGSSSFTVTVDYDVPGAHRAFRLHTRVPRLPTRPWGSGP